MTAAPPHQDVLVAQLSDPHVNRNRPEQAHALERAVRHLLALPRRPDAVLLTGDTTDHGDPAEYARLRELLSPLSMPVYAVPGNHDDREALRGTFGEQGTARLPGFVQFAADVGPVRLLMLDTLTPGQSGGQLCGARLEWLGTQLAQAPDSPTLVCLHHPPLVTGMQIMDDIALENPQALEAAVSRHPQVLRVLCGHTHMTATRAFAGTLLMTVAGPDESLLPDLGQPAKLIVQPQPGLCLLHHWRPTSGLLTFTSVIGDAPLRTMHDGRGWVG